MTGRSCDWPKIDRFLDVRDHVCMCLDKDEITVDEIGNFMSELRAMAYNLLRGEHAAASVRPTALVISGLRRYKLKDQEWEEVKWDNRAHFFKTVYMMMRRALIDYARKRRASVRPRLTGYEEEIIDLYHLERLVEHTPDIIVALEESLAWLSDKNGELAIIVQHHYFSGLSISEIAKFCDVSEKND